MDNKSTNNNQNGHESESEAHDVNVKSAEVDTSAEVDAPAEVNAPAESRTAQAAEPEPGEPVETREQLSAQREGSKDATDEQDGLEDELGDEDESEDEEANPDEEETNPDEETKPGEEETAPAEEEEAEPDEEETKPAEREETKPGAEEVVSPQEELFPAERGPAVELGRIVELAPRAELGATPATQIEHARAGDPASKEERGSPSVAAQVDSFFQDMCAYYRGVLAGLVVDEPTIKRVTGHFDEVYKAWHARVFERDSDTRADRASFITMAM